MESLETPGHFGESGVRCSCRSPSTVVAQCDSGLLPIIQWLISLERNPQPTRQLLTIERLQAWSMLAYYPLEHLYYLCSHGVIPSTIPSLRSLVSSTAKPIKLDLDAVGVWSSRFWALYVLLQFAHLREDRKLLKARERSLRKAKGSGISASEKEELRQRWDAYWNEVIVNIGYLPLTIHWYVCIGCPIPNLCLILLQVVEKGSLQE